MTLQQMAEEFGVSRQRISQIGRKLGLRNLRSGDEREKPKPNFLTPEEPAALPVLEDGYIKPPSLARLMAGR
jgi:hypothetical protein